MKKILCFVFVLSAVVRSAVCQTLAQVNAMSAMRGDAEAQVNMAMAYVFGDGVDVNYGQAVQWAKKSAAQGHARGQYMLAVLYEEGKGVAEDQKMAADLYLQSARGGFLEGQMRIGSRYLYGKGVPVNYEKALYWLQKAADAGQMDAQMMLGECYFYGKGVKQDYSKAFYWLKKGADQGQVNAQAGVGVCYYQGLGVKENKELGEKWLRKAADQGEEHAIAALNDIKKWKEEENAKKKGENKPQIDVDINIPTTGVMSENTFAVIIGNENYRHVDGVPYAGSDAKVVKEYFRKTLGIPERQIFFVADGGYNDLRAATNWLTKAMEVCRGEGKAIFYYAGHGIPNEKDNTSYLLPVDGVGNDPGSAYSLHDLYERLGNMEAKSVLVFLDACFSGSKRDQGMLVSARGVAIKSKPSQPKGQMVVFSAAQGDETAYPYKKMEHGMFTYYFLKKLQSTKGDVTLGALSDYIGREVGRQSFLENKKSQTPTAAASPTLGDTWRNMKLK